MDKNILQKLRDAASSPQIVSILNDIVNNFDNDFYRCKQLLDVVLAKQDIFEIDCSNDALIEAAGNFFLWFLPIDCPQEPISQRICTSKETAAFFEHALLPNIRSASAIYSVTRSLCRISWENRDSLPHFVTRSMIDEILKTLERAKTDQDLLWIANVICNYDAIDSSLSRLVDPAETLPCLLSALKRSVSGKTTEGVAGAIAVLVAHDETFKQIFSTVEVATELVLALKRVDHPEGVEWVSFALTSLTGDTSRPALTVFLDSPETTIPVVIRALTLATTSEALVTCLSLLDNISDALPPHVTKEYFGSRETVTILLNTYRMSIRGSGEGGDSRFHEDDEDDEDSRNSRSRWFVNEIITRIADFDTATLSMLMSLYLELDLPFTKTQIRLLQTRTAREFLDLLLDRRNDDFDDDDDDGGSNSSSSSTAAATRDELRFYESRETSAPQHCITIDIILQKCEQLLTRDEDIANFSYWIDAKWSIMKQVIATHRHRILDLLTLCLLPRTNPKGDGDGAEAVTTAIFSWTQNCPAALTKSSDVRQVETALSVNMKLILVVVMEKVLEVLLNNENNNKNDDADSDKIRNEADAHDADLFFSASERQVRVLALFDIFVRFFTEDGTNSCALVRENEDVFCKLMEILDDSLSVSRSSVPLGSDDSVKDSGGGILSFEVAAVLRAVLGEDGKWVELKKRINTRHVALLQLVDSKMLM